MSNALKGIKKFTFFEIEKPKKCENQKILYSLNDITPIKLAICDKYYYALGQLKSNKQFGIFRIHPSGKIIKEFNPYTDCIIDFEIIKSQDKLYFVVLGTDLRTEQDQSIANAEINGSDKPNKISVTPSPNSVLSIKVLLLPNEEKNDDQEISKEDKNLIQLDIFFLMLKKNKLADLSKANTITDIPADTTQITNITCFSVSPLKNFAALAFQDSFIEIKLDMRNKKDKFTLTQSPDKKIITNMKYIIYNNETFLYYTTTDKIYYKKGGDSKLFVVGNEYMHSGASHQNFDINSNRKIIISTPEKNIIEQYDYDRNEFKKNNTNEFERPIKFIQFFKNYYIFFLYEENKPILCIYEPKSKIFVTFDESFKQKDILFMISTEDRIYILFSDQKSKDIICLREIEDKLKFENFYKKEFYDLAYIFGKNMGYDNEQLSEISKAHAEYLYEKGDFKKSIEQYILTINYLDPTYVIPKFLEDPNKKYLIIYLEELQKNNNFKSKCNPNRFQDFTGLLLNCYIKEKHIDKLKNFVEKNKIKDEATIRTAIDVCKDTNNIDLAFSIAKNNNMEDICIQILIDIKKSYKESLRFINEIKDIKRKFKVLINYGKKLLEEKEFIKETDGTITNLVDNIIKIKNNNPDDVRLAGMKLEQIASIYLTKENKVNLEKLLEKIMNEDANCPKPIILRRIELYMENYLEKEKQAKNSGKEYADKIKDIIRKYKNNLDINYLLMLFKISGFDEGLSELGKIINLEQDLLQIYMEKKDYDKINQTCKDLMKETKDKKLKINSWLKALNFYIDISNESNYNELSVYIIEVLDNLAKQENFSPLNLLDIIKNASNDKNKVIEMKVLRKFLKDWIEQKKDSLENDKRITEENTKEIEKYEKNVKDMKMSSKTFNVSKCSSCKGSLEMPFVYFICGHAYHQNCLDDYDGHFECIVCKDRNKQYFDKLEEGENFAKEPNKYIEELKKENQGNKFEVFASFLGKGIFNINENSK